MNPIINPFIADHFFSTSLLLMELLQSKRFNKEKEVINLSGEICFGRKKKIFSQTAYNNK